MFFIYLAFSKSSFSDYFDGYSQSPQTIINSRITPTSSQVYLKLCMFRELKQTNANGGAIYMSSNSILRVLIEESSFDRCFVATKFSGGAIYSQINQGKMVLTKVCSHECGNGALSTTGNGLFSCVYSLECKFMQTTIIRSYFLEIYNNYHVTIFYNGITIISNNNISNNYAHHGCGVTYSNPTKTTLSYSSIANNIARHSISLYFDGGSNTVDHTNLINNTQQTTYYGIIRQGYLYSTSSSFNYCTVFKNLKSPLIAIYSGSMTFTYCNMDNTPSPAKYTSCSSVFHLNPMNHYASYLCNQVSFTKTTTYRPRFIMAILFLF